MPRVVFVTPDVDIEPETATLERVAHELELIGSRTGAYDGLGAAGALRAALTSPAAEVRIVLDDEWTLQQRGALARALDHVRNAHGLDHEGSRLRAPFVLAIEPRTYGVRSLTGSGAPHQTWSYTGPYDAGDRIVLTDGSEWRVVEVEEAPHGPHSTLVVDEYRRK